MKQIILTQLILIWLSATALAQNYEYDTQSCFNENETVQSALYETLMSEGRIEALNTTLEIPLTEGDVANLRPLTESNATDAELCGYMKSTYTDATWNSLGTIYYRYFFRANEFLFTVNTRIPKDFGDPDFSVSNSRYWVHIVTGFDLQSGFHYPATMSDLKPYPGLILPESAN